LRSNKSQCTSWLAPGNAKASWIDPKTGDSTSIGGGREFSTPEGVEDALLVVESAGDGE
jgi:hypothetical protein